MGEILALGVTHYPPINAKDLARWTGALKFTLRNPGLPAEYRDPANWPEAMRREWGNDEGVTAARRHRDEVTSQFRNLRKILDDFDPDLVVVWGDDQYENFQEDIVPPFCVLAYDDIDVQPWHGAQMKMFGENAWGEPQDQSFRFRGHRPAAKALVASLIAQGFDMAYAYKPLHYDGLPHPFVNTRLFLDYDRKGWNYPMVPIAVNCYGSVVIAQKGGLPDLANPVTGDRFDPPGPSPSRCFDLGRATVRAFADTPHRVALIASSSWSHAFLVEKNHWIFPDNEADRLLFNALRDGDWDTWRNYPASKVEESGQQEVTNWHCVAGALAELGRKPNYCEIIQNYIFNSSKVFMVG
jgi:hypothetical protein